jgi:hypothetical protein
MDELPSRRFSKPVLGRVVLKPRGRQPARRIDYIEVARRPGGSRVYILNVWSRPGIPRVVPETEVEGVEPFERPAC